MGHQKVPKLYFESQFSMSKIDGFKKKKIEETILEKNISEYQFRRPFFVKKTIFFNFNFLTTLFAEIIPNF